MPKFDEFNAAKESFEAWEERLQQYFIVNDTENEKKVANLITFMGAKTYDTLKTYLFPDTPAMKTYDQLVTILKARYAPATSVIYERYRFHSRNQQAEESLEQYVKEVKALSKSCKFEKFLDQALRDRLVCGISNTNIRTKLLSEAETLTFEDACKKALSQEAAECQSKLVKGVAAVSVGKLQMSSKQYRSQSKSQSESRNQSVLKPCFRCGRRHQPETCPAVNWECFFCQKAQANRPRGRQSRDPPISDRLDTINTDVLTVLNAINANMEGIIGVLTYLTDAFIRYINRTQ
uniref:Uncharacterized protein LOC114344743 n=1 Tax=Diabrotica virgifera virgifera TaxID=50390 RepID=A0A6P7GN91_DIAVI